MEGAESSHNNTRVDERGFTLNQTSVIKDRRDAANWTDCHKDHLPSLRAASLQLREASWSPPLVRPPMRGACAAGRHALPDKPPTCVEDSADGRWQRQGSIAITSHSVPDDEFLDAVARCLGIATPRREASNWHVMWLLYPAIHAAAP